MKPKIDSKITQDVDPIVLSIGMILCTLPQTTCLEVATRVISAVLSPLKKEEQSEMLKMMVEGISQHLEESTPPKYIPCTTCGEITMTNQETPDDSVVVCYSCSLK